MFLLRLRVYVHRRSRHVLLIEISMFMLLGNMGSIHSRPNCLP